MTLASSYLMSTDLGLFSPGLGLNWSYKDKAGLLSPTREDALFRWLKMPKKMFHKKSRDKINRWSPIFTILLTKSQFKLKSYKIRYLLLLFDTLSPLWSQQNFKSITQVIGCMTDGLNTELKVH